MNTLDTRRRIALLLIAASGFCGAAVAAPRAAVPAPRAAVPAPRAAVPAPRPAAAVGSGASGSTAASSTTTRELKVTFADMGADSMALQGVQSSAVVNLGIRRDEVVVGAAMHLKLTYSPSLLQDLSHLRVTLNGQTTGALPLPKADAGKELVRTIDLDPRYFTDYNQIRLDLIGHYALQCEDPEHSSIWATIGGQSDITLTLRPIELRDDLAALPAPFFDPHDNGRLDLPIVLPAGASRDIIRSAGVAASWFGMLADYRSARFPVSFDALPNRHGLVFATNASRPGALALAEVAQPTISIVDHPQNPSLKLLVFQGKDETQLRQAVEALVLGSAILTGNSASVAKVSFGRRPAYDAPRWVRTDRPVKIGELIDSPDQLQAHGIAPAAMNVNLRLPPDLFTWNRVGVPVDLHYRYTAPAERDNSVLTVSINGQLLRSYRLPPESESGSAGRFFVPLLQNDGSRESRGLLIPAFQLASDNQMQFQFAMDFHREAMCKEVFVDNTRESIDPDSTVDISSFAHYAALPNLALFANAGFPFTRYADLGETAVVLPDAADRTALEQLFFVLGRMGRQTGAAALAYRLLDPREAESAKDTDLLVLSGPASNTLLEHWGKNLALVFGRLGRDYRQLARAPNPISGTAQPDAQEGAPPNVVIRANGSLGALLGFESRVSSGRTVVALAGSDDAAAKALVAALEDPSKVPLIRGEITIVRDESVQSFQGSDAYYVGSLSWWQWLWFHLSRHSLILTLVSLAVAVALGLFIYGRLQRVVARRLEGRSGA
jgi:cellulose synthase operon protein B